IGCFLTEPKPTVWFETTPQASLPSPGDGLCLDRRTRMLYRGSDFYINGEALQPVRAGSRARSLLVALADQRGLDAAQTAQAIRLPWLRDKLAQWLACGWVIAGSRPNSPGNGRY